MLGVLAFTLVFSSCKKYDNDFAALKDQIAALATQVAGVTALQSQLTATTAQVTALQTAVASVATNQGTQSASLTTLAANLATAKTAIDGITTTLGTVAIAGTATKGIVDQLKLDLTALAGQVTTLGTTVNVNNTAAIAANTLTLGKIADAQTSLNNIVTFEGTLATQAVVNALGVQLAAQQAVVDQILVNTSMYTGAVTIKTDTDVAFFKTKINQIAIVNGALTVDPALITNLTDMNLVLAKISAVIGNTTITANVATAKALNLSNLTAVSGDVSVAGTNLITQAAVDISKLALVSGDFTYSLDGPISLPLLASVNKAIITSYTRTPAAGTTTVGTTSVNLPLLVIAGPSINTGSFASATSVVMPVKGLAAVDTPLATSVTLNGLITGNIAIDAPLATTITVNATTAAGNISLGLTSPSTVAGVISFPNLATTTGTGIINVNAGTSTSVGFPVLTSTGTGNVNITSANTATAFDAHLLATAGAVTVNYNVGAGTVDLSALTASAVTVTGPIALSLPSLVSGQVICSTAKTVTLAKHECVLLPTLAAVETLTIGSLNRAALTLSSYPTVKIASVTGKAAGTIATVTTTIANTALTTLTLAGPLVSAEVKDNAALTSLVTSGAITSFTLEDCDVLASAATAHTGGAADAGSTFVVNDNAILTTVTTATNFMTALTVTSNPLLTSLTCTSYTTQATAGSPSITISGNKLSYTYTNAVAAVAGVSPYLETTITSAALNTLKAYVAAAATPTLSINLDYIGATATLLSAKMKADPVAGNEYKKTCSATSQPVMAAGALGVDDVTITDAAGTQVGAALNVTTTTVTLNDAARAGINNKVEMTRVQ